RADSPRWRSSRPARPGPPGVRSAAAIARPCGGCGPLDGAGEPGRWARDKLPPSPRRRPAKRPSGAPRLDEIDRSRETPSRPRAAYTTRASPLAMMGVSSPSPGTPASMKHMRRLPEEIRWVLWDLDFDRLDADADADSILARTLEHGRLSDVRAVLS